MTPTHRKALRDLASRPTGDPHLDRMVQEVVAQKLEEQKKA